MALFHFPKPLNRLQKSSVPFKIIESAFLAIICIQYDTQIQKEISKPILYTLVPLMSYPIIWAVFHLIRRTLIVLSNIKVFNLGSKIFIELLDAACSMNQKLAAILWVHSPENERSNNLTLVNKDGSMTINGNIHVGSSNKSKNP